MLTVNGATLLLGLAADADVATVVDAELPCVMLATEVPGFAAAVCACGTVPVPGVPIPGNTVPCCKLPSFG